MKITDKMGPTHYEIFQVLLVSPREIPLEELAFTRTIPR